MICNFILRFSSLAGFESGDELVAADGGTPGKDSLKLQLGAGSTARKRIHPPHRRPRQKPLRAASDLRATQFVKRYLEGLHIPAQGLHRAALRASWRKSPATPPSTCPPGRCRPRPRLRPPPRAKPRPGRALRFRQPVLHLRRRSPRRLCVGTSVSSATAAFVSPPSAGTELFCVSSTTEESRCSPETGRVEFSVAILSDFNLTVCKTI